MISMTRRKEKTVKEGAIESAFSLYLDNTHAKIIEENMKMFEETNPIKSFPYKLGKFITDIKAIIDEELGKYKETVHEFFSKLFLGK